MSPNRLYTRTGDAGETGLLRGGRVSKADPRVEAYGTVDEANAFLGAALVEVRLLPPSADRDAVAGVLDACQSCLMRLAAEVASGGRAGIGVGVADVSALERWIDDAQGRVPDLTHFLVPGVARAEAALHVARTACRRAERRLVALPAEQAPVEGVRFLNRLSDLLFALARVATAAEGGVERVWRGGGE
jgi:cob(I)alamin adenosyltransferase